MRDPYDVLGVPRTADGDTIRKAYKKLARTWHPDISKRANAEERFKEVNAAYDVLGDEDKRKHWDEFGEASTRPGFDAQKARAWGAGGVGGFGGGGVDVEDLLGSIFGGGAGPRARRGADQAIRLEVDFLTTVTGGERKVSIRRPDGTLETLTVRIPAGSRDGVKLRLRGQGLPPRGGGPCGDLLVRLHVPPHAVLRRGEREDDLEMDVPLTVREALQGASITVPTPTGDIRLTVPPGVVSSRRMRVKGRGVQRRGRPGDLFLMLRPVLPDLEAPHVVQAAVAMDDAYTGPVRRGLKL